MVNKMLRTAKFFKKKFDKMTRNAKIMKNKMKLFMSGDFKIKVGENDYILFKEKEDYLIFFFLKDYFLIYIEMIIRRRDQSFFTCIFNENNS